MCKAIASEKNVFVFFFIISEDNFKLFKSFSHQLFFSHKYFTWSRMFVLCSSIIKLLRPAISRQVKIKHGIISAAKGNTIWKYHIPGSMIIMSCFDFFFSFLFTWKERPAVEPFWTRVFLALSLPPQVHEIANIGFPSETVTLELE